MITAQAYHKHHFIRLFFRKSFLCNCVVSKQENTCFCIRSSLIALYDRLIRLYSFIFLPFNIMPLVVPRKTCDLRVYAFRNRFKMSLISVKCIVRNSAFCEEFAKKCGSFVRFSEEEFNYDECRVFLAQFATEM